MRPRRFSFSSNSSEDPASPVWGSPSRERRPSISSLGSDTSSPASKFSRRPSIGSAESMRGIVDSQTELRDHSDFFPVTIIISAIVVATCCGVAAFALHLSVQLAGCLGGVNGCQKSVVLDLFEPSGNDLYFYGISHKSLYFILSSGLSGLCCSLIIYSPLQSAIMCKGGGSSGTKIAISAGRKVSIWVVVLRIALAALYMGGGNTLGTEGPIIHVSTALATCLISAMGGRRRKLLSMFGVIGAAAGISAGFNLLVTGFIYTTEEITRSLSRKLALILALAAAVAMFVAHSLHDWLERWLHSEHVSLVPPQKVWAELTTDDVHACLVLCIPIGMLNGVAGWVFTQLAWAAQEALKPPAVGKQHPGHCHINLPVKSHLAIIGLICGSFGAVAYELTGMNGVWGTTAGAIPEAIAKNLTWDKVLILFATKFSSFVLATAGGGPGGLLVPSLVTGGYMGLAVGLFVGGSEALSSACAVLGMGSLFASVMHLPVSGIIIVFELTRSPDLIMPVVIANFISSNVASRLPHGEDSFVHRNLDRDPTWLKLGKQDFIETDQQEHLADHVLSAFKEIFKSDSQRKREAFDAWLSVVHNALDAVHEEEMEARFTMGMDSIYDQIFQATKDVVFLHTVWSAWHTLSTRSRRSHFSSHHFKGVAAPPNGNAANAGTKLEIELQICERNKNLGLRAPTGDTPMQLNYNENAFGEIPHPWLHGDSAHLGCNFDEDIREGSFLKDIMCEDSQEGSTVRDIMCDQPQPPQGRHSLAKGRRDRLGSRTGLSATSSATSVAADAWRVLKHCNAINRAAIEIRPTFDADSMTSPIRLSFDSVATATS